MKASKFSEAQIAFVLKQAEDGRALAKSAGRKVFRRRRSTIGASAMPA